MQFPSLNTSYVSVKRRSSTIDDEGTPVASWSEVSHFRGGFGSSVSTREDVSGAQGQRIDAAVSTMGNPNVFVGDKLTIVGRDWAVVGIRHTGATTRILLAQWGNQ